MQDRHKAGICRHKGWHKVRMSLGAACLCFVLPLTSWAGREPEEWDDLPQVDSISFSKTSVGLSTSSGKYFVLDRTSNTLQEVDKNKFFQDLGGATGPKAAEVKKATGINSIVALKTSSGKEFTTQNAYCSEGDDSHHALWLEGVSVKDRVDPCYSISAAEIIDHQLWLGTRADGEYGDYPAEGIVVQSVDTGQLIKRLGVKQGLTGNLIRTIRFDPITQSVWVATERGINEIDRGFRVSQSLFFYQDLDSQTGTPKISLTPSWRKSNPLATLFKQLRVSDAKKFYAAASQIPPAIQERFINGLNGSVYSPDNTGSRSLEQAFAPREVNVLVPFFLEAARSPNEDVRRSAMFYIFGHCAFNDPRVAGFLVEESKSPRPKGDWYIAKCVDKYVKFGLMAEPHQEIRLLTIDESRPEENSTWVSGKGGATVNGGGSFFWNSVTPPQLEIELPVNSCAGLLSNPIPAKKALFIVGNGRFLTTQVSGKYIGTFVLNSVSSCELRNQ